MTIGSRFGSVEGKGDGLEWHRHCRRQRCDLRLGIFGAWVYYWQQADGLWEHAYAIFEGLFWPAWMVYYVFAALHA